MFTKKSAQEHRHLTKEIQGIILIGWSLLILLSLLSFNPLKHQTNWLGLIGDTIGLFCHYCIGYAAYFIPLFLGWSGISFLTAMGFPHFYRKILYFSIFLCSTAILLAVLGYSFHTRAYLGGVPFHQLYIGMSIFNLNLLLGALGTFLIFFLSAVLSALVLTGISPIKACHFLYGLAKLSGSFLWQQFKKIQKWQIWTKYFPTKKKQTEVLAETMIFSSKPKSNLVYSEAENDIESYSRKHPLQSLKIAIPHIEQPASRTEKTTVKVAAPAPIKEPEDEILPIESPKSPEQKRAAAIIAQKIHLGDFSLYKLPGAPLLTQVKKVDQTVLKNDLRRYADVLEETLLSFGIEAKVGEIYCGPTITSFEVHPAIGVKVQKIKALENDLALNMQAKSIRIIAPIPGKAAVGIEIPNPRPIEVSFREMLENYQSQEKKFHIPILLGKMVNGEDVASDLTKMPHCIIAGATGSGKSVCINTIVMSIVMNMRPDEVKLLMVDPKKVELTAYSQLPHMLAPVITEPQGACAALNWLVKEMENRYEIFRQIGARNILSFNHREINQELEGSLEITVPEKLPYIVVIIDELADLMMVSSSDIETPIARIAQMARAVGIHLVLATQRPSREVITGLIKANFPARIAFKVASRINSQIIIDETGAETLLGNGDMLFLPPGSSNLVRAQGAFIRDEDINKVIKSICEQAPTQYLIPSFDQYKATKTDAYQDDEVVDALYEQALSIVLDTGNAATTFLQRKLKIGYARAASLMDQLESRGIIGPQEGAKPRKILYSNHKAEDENLIPEEE